MGALQRKFGKKRNFILYGFLFLIQLLVESWGISAQSLIYQRDFASFSAKSSSERIEQKVGYLTVRLDCKRILLHGSSSLRKIVKHRRGEQTNTIILF